MDTKNLLIIFVFMTLLSPLVVPVNASIPMEDEDEDFGCYTDCWAWAWLYAEYNPYTNTYHNIQHDWDWTLEYGYTYQVWELYSDNPQYPSTRTQILVFINYWRQDALAEVEFEPL